MSVAPVLVWQRHLSTINWNVPQSRKRVYLVLVHESLASKRDMVAFEEIFKASFPANRNGDPNKPQSTIADVRAYVAEVLRSENNRAIQPEPSQDNWPSSPKYPKNVVLKQQVTSFHAFPGFHYKLICPQKRSRTISNHFWTMKTISNLGF